MFHKAERTFFVAAVALDSDRGPAESCSAFKGRRKLCIKLQGHKSAQDMRIDYFSNI